MNRKVIVNLCLNKHRLHHVFSGFLPHAQEQSLMEVAMEMAMEMEMEMEMEFNVSVSYP